jgi:hypothetical protein
MRSSFMRRLHRAPAFPLFPFVPLVVASGLVALEILTFARLVSLGRSVEQALRIQSGGATA